MSENLRLAADIISKLSQNICLLIHIFRYIVVPDVTASYGMPFEYFHTLLMTIHVWIALSPPNFHWLCIYSILIWQNARCDSKLWYASNFFHFLTKWTNIHVWSVLTSPNIHKLCIWCEYKYFVIAKCQVWLQVMATSLILLRFLGIYIIEDHSFLNCSIFTKLI